LHKIALADTLLAAGAEDKHLLGNKLSADSEAKTRLGFGEKLSPSGKIGSWDCPKLCNPLEAKRRMGLTNKTDKLDAKGLAILLRNGTLPEVWIPPSELRDQRELLRLRIFLVRMRTRVKNRIHGTLSRYRRPEIPLLAKRVIAQELSSADIWCFDAPRCRDVRHSAVAAIQGACGRLGG